MDEYRQITRKGSPPYFARGLARLTRSPWRAVVSARLGGISTGALSNLLPTKSIGRRSARRSTTRPLRRPTRPPSASSRASPTPSSAAAPPAALASRIAEVLNIICQEIGTISLLGAAGRLHGGHAASGWNGIYLASESPGPARVFRERRAGPSKPLSRPGVRSLYPVIPSHRVDKGASALA